MTSQGSWSVFLVLGCYAPSKIEKQHLSQQLTISRIAVFTQPGTHHSGIIRPVTGRLVLRKVNDFRLNRGPGQTAKQVLRSKPLQNHTLPDKLPKMVGERL